MVFIYTSFVLFDLRSHYAAQANLKILSSSYPPASDFRVARVPGTCHHAQLFLFMYIYLLHAEQVPYHQAALSAKITLLSFL